MPPAIWSAVVAVGPRPAEPAAKPRRRARPGTPAGAAGSCRPTAAGRATRPTACVPSTRVGSAACALAGGWMPRSGTRRPPPRRAVRDGRPSRAGQPRTRGPVSEQSALTTHTGTITRAGAGCASGWGRRSYATETRAAWPTYPASWRPGVLARGGCRPGLRPQSGLVRGGAPGSAGALDSLPMPPRRPDPARLLAAVNAQRAALGHRQWSGAATERGARRGRPGRGEPAIRAGQAAAARGPALRGPLPASACSPQPRPRPRGRGAGPAVRRDPVRPGPAAHPRHAAERGGDRRGHLGPAGHRPADLGQRGRRRAGQRQRPARRPSATFRCAIDGSSPTWPPRARRRLISASGQ